MRPRGISARQLEANRANARASTGPRTPTGKARASQNSRKHGLSVPIESDPRLASLVSAIAGELAGPEASACRQDLAGRIAEAQAELIRAQRARAVFLRRALGEIPAAVRIEDPSLIAAMVATLSRRLMGFDRYERRALSRRKFLIRQFDES
jgi:hypothetical protein